MSKVPKGEIDRVTRLFTERGEIIDAGWHGYRLAVMSPDAPQVQLDECRMAFFAGCQHLFSSMMSVLDPSDEPTESDLRMLANIHAELKSFIAVFNAKHGLKE